MRIGRRNAFTLIELLVVVAIIAILAGILLPAMGRARASAKRTYCQANLHSVGQAIRGYMTEYHDYYPPMAIMPKDTNGNPNDPRLGMGEILLPLVSNQNKVFHCLADCFITERTKIIPNPPADKQTWFDWQGSSYEPRMFLSLVDNNGYWRLSKEFKPLGEEVTGSSPEAAKMREFFETLPKLTLAYDYESFHGEEGTPNSRMALYADFHVDAMNEK